MITLFEEMENNHNKSNLNLSMDSINESPQDENKFKSVENLLKEVVFDENAPVAECFLSVLKAWRIHSPNVI